MGELVPGSPGASAAGSGLCCQHPLTSQGRARAGYTALSHAFEGEPGWLSRAGGVGCGGGALIDWLPPGSPRVVLIPLEFFTCSPAARLSRVSRAKEQPQSCQREVGG